MIGWDVRAGFSFNINLQSLNHQSCFILFFKITANFFLKMTVKAFFLKLHIFGGRKYIVVPINFKTTPLAAKSKNHTV